MFCFDLRFNTKKDGKFWFIECPDYPVFTQGRTKKEAKENLKEAFLLYASDSDAQAKHPELKQLFAQQPTQVKSLTVTFAVPVDSFLSAIYAPLADSVRKTTGENPL